LIALGTCPTYLDGSGQAEPAPTLVGRYLVPSTFSVTPLVAIFTPKNGRFELFRILIAWDICNIYNFNGFLGFVSSWFAQG
jgi:hypothetical protein